MSRLTLLVRFLVMLVLVSITGVMMLIPAEQARGACDDRCRLRTEIGSCNIGAPLSPCWKFLDATCGYCWGNNGAFNVHCEDRNDHKNTNCTGNIMSWYTSYSSCDEVCPCGANKLFVEAKMTGMQVNVQLTTVSVCKN